MLKELLFCLLLALYANHGHSFSDAYFIEGAIRNDPGYLFLVWSPVYLENEGDRGFLEYNVSVECTGGMKTFNITNTTTHTFNNLPDDTECHFTVMSNMDGCSSGSRSGLVGMLRLRTSKLVPKAPSFTPMGSIENLVLTIVFNSGLADSTSVECSLTANKEMYDIIFVTDTQTIISNDNKWSISVPKPGEYQVKCAAVNEAGRGSYSNPSSVMVTGNTEMISSPGTSTSQPNMGCFQPDLFTIIVAILAVLLVLVLISLLVFGAGLLMKEKINCFKTTHHESQNEFKTTSRSAESQTGKHSKRQPSLSEFDDTTKPEEGNTHTSTFT